MRNPKKYNLPEVFNDTNIGFVFEFFSSKDTNFIVENLSKLVAKNVILTNSTTYEPTYSKAILLKEYEGKKPRYSFKFARQNFMTAIPLLKEVLGWISETSECTFNTVMKVNMSFNHERLNTLQTISKMNPQKLILKFDEEYIYERFADQEFSPYSISINQLLPLNETVYSHDLIKNVNYVVGVPTKSYYGINFVDYTRGILEFNYIGGFDYAEKEKEIIEILEYYVIKTYQSINENDYTKNELIKLKNLTQEFYKIQEAYYEIDKFKELFPEIQIGIDIRQDSQLLKSYWPKIRNTLFDLVINNDLREGQFNYDRDFGANQLRHAKLNCTTIKNFDLVRCDITGIVENCNLISCEIDNARIYNSKIVKGTNISDSYLSGVSIERENNIENCFVENNYELLNCNIRESIVKFAGIGKSARLDESSVIITREDHVIPSTSGIEIEEIRDYKWFKDLLGKKPEGHEWANEYKKKRYI